MPTIKLDLESHDVYVDGGRHSNRPPLRLFKSLVAVRTAIRSGQNRLDEATLFPGPGSKKDWKQAFGEFQDTYMLNGFVTQTRGEDFWRINPQIASRVFWDVEDDATVLSETPPHTQNRRLPTLAEVRHGLIMVELIRASSIGEFADVDRLSKLVAQAVEQPPSARPLPQAFGEFPVVALIIAARAHAEVGDWIKSDRAYRDAADLLAHVTTATHSERALLSEWCTVGLAENLIRSGQLDEGEKALKAATDDDRPLPFDGRLHMRRCEVLGSLLRRRGLTTSDPSVTEAACFEYVKACRFAIVTQRLVDFLRCLCKLGTALTTLHFQIDVSAKGSASRRWDVTVDQDGVRDLALVCCFGALDAQVGMHVRLNPKRRNDALVRSTRPGATAERNAAPAGFGSDLAVNAMHALAMSMRAIRHLAHHDIRVLHRAMFEAGCSIEAKWLVSHEALIAWCMTKWVPNLDSHVASGTRFSAEASALVIGEIMRSVAAARDSGLLNQKIYDRHRTSLQRLANRVRTECTRTERPRVIEILTRAEIRVGRPPGSRTPHGSTA